MPETPTTWENAIARGLEGAGREDLVLEPLDLAAEARKRARKQLTQTVEGGTLGAPPVPGAAPISDSPPHSPADTEAPGALPSVKEIEERARIRGEGNRLAGQELGTILGSIAEKAGRSGEGGLSWAMEHVRNRARGDAQGLGSDHFRVLQIDAMQRFGKSYKTGFEALQNYERDEAEYRRELDAPMPRPKTPPTHTILAVDSSGRQLEIPMGEGEDWERFAKVAQHRMSGTMAGAAFGGGVPRDISEKQMAVHQNMTPEEAEKLGYHKAAKRIRVSALQARGQKVRRNQLVVYIEQDSSGNAGVSINDTFETLSLYYIDEARRKQAALTGNRSPPITDEMREEAESRAREDINRVTNRVASRGNIAVVTDPEGLQRKILRGEVGLLGTKLTAIPEAMRFVGLEDTADWTAKAMAPFVAMSIPSSLTGATSSTSYGKNVMASQMEHPMHWLMRAGVWSPVMAYAYDEDPDPNRTWGDSAHVSKVMEGHDFSQDMYKIGSDLGGMVGADPDSTTSWLLGGGAVIAMSFIDADPLTLATMGLGKGASLAAKGTKLAATNVQLARLNKVLGAAEATGDFHAIIRQLENLHPGHADAFRREVIASLAEMGAKSAESVETAAETITAAQKAADKAVDKAVDKAGTKVSKAEEALDKGQWANRKQTKAYEVAWNKYDAYINQVRNKWGDRAADLMEKMKVAADDIAAKEVAAKAAQSKLEVLVKLVPARYAKKLKDNPEMLRTYYSRALKAAKKAEKAADGAKASNAASKDLQKIRELIDAASNKAILDEFYNTRNIYGKAVRTRAGMEKKLAEALEQKVAAKPKSVSKGKINAMNTAGTKLFKARTQVILRERELRAALEAQRRAVAVEKVGITDPDLMLAQVTRWTAANQTRAYRKWDELRRAGKLDFAPPVVVPITKSVLGTEQASADLLKTLEATYGAERVASDPIMDLLKQERISFDTTKKPGAAAAQLLRDAELRLARRVHAEDVVGEALPAKLAMKDIFDPDIGMKMDWTDPQKAMMKTLQSFEKFRRYFSPHTQIMGKVSENLETVARRGIDRIEVLQQEMRGILEHGGTLEDVVQYLTTKQALETIGGKTVLNVIGDKTLFEKWLAQVQGVNWEHIKKMTPEDMPTEVSALARMWLPPGVYGDVAAQRAGHTLIKALDELQEIAESSKSMGSRQAFNLLQKKLMKTTYAVTRKTDADQTALRFMIGGILHGAALYDHAADMTRVFGRITPDDVKQMNMVFRVGEQGGNITKETVQASSRASLQNALRLWDEMGVSVGHDQITRLSLGAAQTDRALKKWAVANAGDVSATPNHILAYFNGQAGKIVKELERAHPQDTAGWVAKAKFMGWMNLWRRSTVLGLFLPRPAHFTNTYFGDMAQLMWSRGLVQGSKLMLTNSFTYLGPVGRRAQDAVHGYAQANGGVTSLLFNPSLTAVLRGDPDAIFETAEGAFSAQQLLSHAKLDGVAQSIVGKDLEEMTARTLGRSSLPGFWQKKVSGQWTGLMENIQYRTRMAQYLEDRVVRKVPREKSIKNLHESLYDWRHGATEFELQTLAPFSGFYMFWRGAYTQLAHSIMEPITLPVGEALLRGATGQSKLGRAVSQGQVVNALPEWLYWDNPEEEVSDREAWMDWAKRRAPWWLGARPRTISTRKTFAEWEREYQRTGKMREWEVNTLPALTTMDALYMMAVMAQVGMAGVSEEVRLSEDATEQILEQMTEKLGPIFQVFAENALNMGYEGRKGVPLRAGELEVLDLIDGMGGPFAGFRDAVTTADSDGRRYMPADVKNSLAVIFRTLPVVGTEIPAYLAAYNNDRWEAGARAGAVRMLQQISNFGKVYTVNPAEEHERELRQTRADLAELVKRGEQGGTAEYRDSGIHGR